MSGLIYKELSFIILNYILKSLPLTDSNTLSLSETVARLKPHPPTDEMKWKTNLSK